MVDLYEIKSVVKTLNKIKTCVDQGLPVILFPDGATYIGRLTKPFKNGSFRITVDAKSQLFQWLFIIKIK
jgi:1-acyl-sn-glycerol-3-phosphate acyltransferase